MKKLLLLGFVFSLFVFIVGCSNNDTATIEEKNNVEKVEKEKGKEKVEKEDVVLEDVELEPKEKEGIVSEEEQKLMGDNITNLVSNELLKVSEEGNLNGISKENQSFFEKATEDGKYDIKSFSNWTVYSEVSKVTKSVDSTYDVEVKINLGYVEEDPTSPLSETIETRKYTAKKNGSDFNVSFKEVVK